MQVCSYVKLADATKDLDPLHFELIRHILHTVTKRIECTPEIRLRIPLQRLPLFQEALAISCTLLVIRVRYCVVRKAQTLPHCLKKDRIRQAVRRYVMIRNWCSQLLPGEEEL
jgi:hypothetical protein